MIGEFMSDDFFQISREWLESLTPYYDFSQSSFLIEYVTSARQNQIVHPKLEDVFRVFAMLAPNDVRVVILGQDPYPTPGHAHGLAFSVQPNVRIPASLRNIYKELHADLGIEPASHGHLNHWAEQGVMLLNTVLTVTSRRIGSHRKKGWEAFTDAVILALAERESPIVFLLWGADATKKKALIGDRHFVITSPHPSPMSASKGFFGSQPFSKTNAKLREWGQTPIDWRV
jgi:uracil-DNA glycosylase